MTSAPDQRLRAALEQLEQAPAPFPVPSRDDLLDGSRRPHPAVARGRGLVLPVAAAAVVTLAVGVALLGRADGGGTAPAPATSPTDAANPLATSVEGEVVDCDGRPLHVRLAVPRTTYQRGAIVVVTVTVSNRGPACATTLLGAAGLTVRDARGTQVYVSCTADTGNVPCTADLPVRRLAADATGDVEIRWDTADAPASALGVVTIERFGLTLPIRLSQ